MGDAYRDPHSMRCLTAPMIRSPRLARWIDFQDHPVSGTQYSGRNFLYTYVYGMMRGYADPRWATEKQIKDMDAEEAEGADTVLAETFNSMDALSTDAAIDLLQVYSSCDASGRDAVAKTFYALSGESFDSYLMTASEVCKKTLGMLEPEPPQPAKTKNLSQKTASSREASTRLSDEIGAKPCTRDEGTVGDS